MTFRSTKSMRRPGVAMMPSTPLESACSCAFEGLGLIAHGVLHVRAAEDREQERPGLPGTGLRAAHQVPTHQREGNRVLLDRGGHLPAAQLDVTEHEPVHLPELLALEVAEARERGN